MPNFLLFLIIYALFLSTGLIFAFLFRRYARQKKLASFRELIKLRSYLYSQINALMRAYDDFLKDQRLFDENRLALSGAATLFKDIETNLVVLKTELTDLTLPEKLVKVREEMLKIVENLSNHIFSILSAKRATDILKVLDGETLEKQKRGFKLINKSLKEFIRIEGLNEEDYFSEEEWLYL